MPSATCSAGLSLDYLPVDGIHTIFSFLPLEEAVRVVRVCRCFQRSLWTSSPEAREEYKRPDNTEHGWWETRQESVCGSGSFAALKSVKDTNGRYVEVQAETNVAAGVGKHSDEATFVWAGSSLRVSPPWALCPLRRLRCLVSCCPHLTSLTVSYGNCQLSLEHVSTLLFGLYTRLRCLTVETEAEEIAVWERLTAPHLSDYFDELSESNSEPSLGQAVKARVGWSTKTKRDLESVQDDDDDISSPTRQIIGPQGLYVWSNLQSLRLIGPAAVVNVRLFCRRMCYPDLRELEVHLNIKPPRESICRTSPPSVSCSLPSNSVQPQFGSHSAPPAVHPFLRALSTNPTAHLFIGLPAGVPVPVTIEALYDWTATLAGCKRCFDDAEEGGIMPKSRAEEIRQTKQRLLSCRRRAAETESLKHSSPPIATLQSRESGESGEPCCYREGAGFRLDRVLFEIRGLANHSIYQHQEAFEEHRTGLSNRYVANVVLRLMWDLLWKHQYRPLRLEIGLHGAFSHACDREAPGRLPAGGWPWLRPVNVQGFRYEEDEPMDDEQGLAREAPPLPGALTWEIFIPEEGLHLRGGYGDFDEPGDGMPYVFRVPPPPRSSTTPPNVLVCKCVRDSLCGIPHWNLSGAVDDWFFTHYSNLERIYDSRGEFDRFVDLTAPPYEMY